MGKDVYGGCATLNGAPYRRWKSRDLYKEATYESWVLEYWIAKHAELGLVAAVTVMSFNSCTVAWVGISAIIFF
jgi:hypothetical protein